MLPIVEHSLDPLSLLHLEDVDDVGPLGGFAGDGNLIALLPVDLSGVREEEDIVVGGGGEPVHHIVLLPGGDALLAHAALGLGGVLADGGSLDIPRLGQGEDALLFLDEVLDVDFVLHVLDFRHSFVAVLSGDSGELLFQNLADQSLVGEDFLEIGNALFQLLVLVFQLLPV